MLIELPYAFPGKVYRSPMPFSSFDSTGVWDAYLEEDIDLVLILAEKQEFLVYAGRDLPAFYRDHGLDVLHIPVPDLGVPPDIDTWKQALARVAREAGEGKRIAVHCLAGIGRTGTFLACLARQNLGLEGMEAIRWVRQKLPGAMENLYQEDFVIHFND